MPDTPDDELSGEKTPTEVQAEIIDQIGFMFKEQDEEAKSDIHFGTGIHQAIEKHYTDMIHRNPDGPDPLVQEPKGKP